MDANVTALITRRKEVFKETAIKYILKETLKGLEFLHARHIIHRDIKSDNILYNTGGDIKLADFGAAVQLTKQHAARQTLMGTDHWIAPEMIQADAVKRKEKDTKYDTKADIWSFGIFAIELALTQPPFYAERDHKKLYKLILD